ncbi:MAG: putative addiction module antidote protein [Candidatus Handelsmanbacteria bacterium RIFCSPLOWO2_12_FULL_64_10]|uniref:Putative addiction module antidote protein n=1 Tax=Handelsmanbacteria sp. (strain RIFCSPLOWO2_12_FULL_64_10) TaxID=1817868 RepID=A0A1F6CLV5_HANXR|nr:MAG: putative addiction module antidote protein [Candidatus Handelsmanbacteria bacterium RIFCSPLOWO2_12_FULL_64_10]
MATSRSYQNSLLESLKDLREAEAYLNASLEENDPTLFLSALRNVAEAQGGVSKFSRRAKLNRESLYRMLSRRGNPQWDSLTRLLKVMGLRLSVGRKRRAS